MPSTRVTGLSILFALTVAGYSHDTTPANAGPSAGQTPEVAAPASQSRLASTSDVEADLRSLHDQIGVTPAQERQWDALSNQVRDISRKMRDMEAEQLRSASSMNMIQVMKAHENMLQARVEGMQRLMPPAEKLYNGMAPDQRKRWDNVMISHQVGCGGLLCRVGLGEGV